MDVLESRPYRVLLAFTNLLLLNLAWALTSLPVITLVPATAAMFGVVRDWRRGDEPTILPAFVRHLRANFRQAFGIGLLWLVTLAALFLDYRLVGELPAAAQFAAVVVLALATAAFAATSVYLFPVMVGYHARWWVVIRNSFLLGISQLHTTFAALLVVAAVAFLATRAPITLMVSASAAAYLIHAICSRGLDRAQRMKSTAT
jgi:uncharacterized membrane protein YesL